RQRLHDRTDCLAEWRHVVQLIDGSPEIKYPVVFLSNSSPPGTHRLIHRGAGHHGCRGVLHRPVLPNPPAFRTVTPRSATSSHVARTTGARTACAIRVPRS